MENYKIKRNDLYKEYNSNKNGLNDKEVAKLLEIHGRNKLDEDKKVSKIVMFLNEFKNLMIIVLLFASVISFFVSMHNNEPYTDSIIILAIVILNAILSLIQELKADESLKNLKKLQVTNTKVLRNGVITLINSEDLVIGDIIELEAGDIVPADARIIEEITLKVDESSLTGESLSVRKNSKNIIKDTVLAERKNMIYSSSNVVFGKCKAIVVSVGMNTEIGKIASSLKNNEEELTPLQIRINSISKFLSILAFIVIFIMFIIGLLKGMDFIVILMLSISLAVSAIPEGLPAVITILLSLGTTQMAKNNAVVRKMSSVETLGCTGVICSDKTGTITKNEMTVREIYFNNNMVVGKKLDENDLLYLNMGLNNNVYFNDKYIGDPTEVALYKYVGVNLKDKYDRLKELPFDSNRKMMSTFNKVDNKIIMFTKGSMDSVLKCSSHILINNKKKKITKKDIDNLLEVELLASNKAYRTLAFAYKEVNSLDCEEDNLVFLGLVSMIDPPREDVKNSISMCRSAGIKPIMITGDSLNTAIAIGKEVGILKNDSEAISGEEFDKFSKDDLVNVVKKYSVYARVSPENKLDIVNAWKANGKVVAMTGDGVNDAPALKVADIGVGMGITGSEVSKGVSDIILTDDSFSTIVFATKEGRRIYDNIRNVIAYLLTGNLAEVLIVFIGMIFGFEIFLPIQLLYINLITDSVPAIALAFEKAEVDIMKRPVRKEGSSFFTPFMISTLCVAAVLKTISVLLVFFITVKTHNAPVATTMAFLMLILLEMIFGYSCKNIKRDVLNKDIFNNSVLNKSMILLLGVQIVLFTTPVKDIFKVSSIGFVELLFTIMIIIVVFIIVEVSKDILSKYFKDE